MMTREWSFTPSFLRGMEQAFDLTGRIASRRLARLRTRPLGAQEALESDWSAVSQDLARALRRYREAHGQ